jgi:hypothetical protein
VNITFQDMVRTQQVTEGLKNGTIPVSQSPRFTSSEMKQLHYEELDRNPIGGTDNEVAKFFWQPPVMNDEHYEMILRHRKGVVSEQLFIKQIGSEWQYAMRVTDPEQNKLLIECRDPLFPVDNEWREELPKCFPKY